MRTRTASNSHEYVVYKRRWGAMVACAAVNAATNTLMLSMSPVATEAAVYFDKEPKDIDLLTAVALLTSVPFAVISTWLVERIGMR